MATRSITRLATTAVVTGIASLALAAPANAQNPKVEPPEMGGASLSLPNPGPVDNPFDYTALAGGALGGIVLAGAGVAAAAGLRRHRNNLAHPV
ncbi:MAG TPA: hypothetical protein VFG63_02820 [Nocardioidaceae bacterium]|nr:hypothetical protein [Nocardioidaceae bacterium]